MDTPADFSPGHRSRASVSSAALWFIVHEERLLVSEGEAPLLPSGAIALPLLEQARVHYFGCLAQRDCMAVNVSEEIAAPAGFRWAGLRSLFLALPDPLLALAGRAIQIVEWDRSHRYCGRCGALMRQKEDERVKVCPACGHTAYPRVSPAMMVLLRRSGKILLARAAHFPGTMYSALAGFVEAGESIEETVQREVREEVGLTVKNLRYFGSQAWPFPHQLMVAFHADYAGGELKPDGKEIVDAQWFSPDRLPGLPTPLSISRRLIESAVDELRPTQAQRGA